MQVPAWQVAAWGDVVVTVDEWTEMAGRLKFCGWNQGTTAEDASMRCGQAIWGSVDNDDSPFGLAWDWEEVKSGVVALSDPMTIVSNVVLVENGKPVDEFKRIVHLNNAIYQLPWQRHARHAEMAECA